MDSEIAGPEDLEGKTVGVQLGTTGDQYCTNEKGDNEYTVGEVRRGDDNKIHNEQLHHHRRAADHSEINPADCIEDFQPVFLRIGGVSNADQRGQASENHADDHGDQCDREGVSQALHQIHVPVLRNKTAVELVLHHGKEV